MPPCCSSFVCLTGLLASVALGHAAPQKPSLAVKFTLSDEMEDAVFDQALTVKVRLPDGWPGVTARQDDREISANIVEHDGVKYVLVEGVPDRGQISLESK